MKIRLPLFAAAVLGCCLGAAPPVRAEDIREKVNNPAADVPVNEMVIDTKGVVFGLPFGASEDDIVKKFGQPAGYILLDAHRTALLYGKSYLLLCFDGNFDGLRISQSAVDWHLNQWMLEKRPFAATSWRLSNGLRYEMNLKTVREMVKVESEDKYRPSFRSEQCMVQLDLSHYTNLGERDEAYKVQGLLMARLHDGKDQWLVPLPTEFSFKEAMKGKKMIGLGLGASQKGVCVTSVHKDSPGDKAGIRPGDLLTGLNGQSTVGMDAAEFTRRIGEQDVNQVEVTGKNGDSKRMVQLERADAATFSNQLIGGRLALSEVSEGDAAPDFEATASGGKKVKLSELKGSPVLVNFTATWCGPCKEEAPILVSAFARYKDQGLKMVSVYLDAADKDVYSYARGLGADWPIYTDGKSWGNLVARAYGISGVPTNVLVGRDGKILVDDVRGIAIEDAVEKALK